MTHTFNDCALSDAQLPAELLAFVPYDIGYQPSDTIVAIGLLPNGNAIAAGVAGSLDLAIVNDSVRSGSARAGIFAHLELQRCDLAYVVVYSHAYFEELSRSHGIDDGEPHLAGDSVTITRELARWYDHAAFDPRRTVIVGESRWRCLSCRLAGHCPPAGHSLRALSGTTFALHMLFDGRTYADTRDRLVRVPAPAPAGRWPQQILQSVRRDHGWPIKGEDAGKTWRRFLTTPVSQWRERDDDERRLALLGASLHSVSVRDNVIYSLCMGVTPRDFHDADADRFGEMFRSRKQPRQQRASEALARVRALVRVCDQGDRVPLLTVWAWCQWWYGNSPEAKALLEHALCLDPRYSLANTLRAVLFRNASPPWAQAQSREGA